MFGAVVGYEGLITKEPVSVLYNSKLLKEDYVENCLVFKDMNEEYFKTRSLGLSFDGTYYYFISNDKREVSLFIEGVKTGFAVIREIIG